MNETLPETLRQAIRKSDLSQARIALNSGLTASQLSRFVNGRKTLTLETGSRLAQALNLKLIESQGQPNRLS